MVGNILKKLTCEMDQDWIRLDPSRTQIRSPESSPLRASRRILDLHKWIQGRSRTEQTARVEKDAIMLKGLQCSFTPNT